MLGSGFRGAGSAGVAGADANEAPLVAYVQNPDGSLGVLVRVVAEAWRPAAEAAAAAAGCWLEAAVMLTDPDAVMQSAYGGDYNVAGDGDGVMV